MQKLNKKELICHSFNFKEITHDFFSQKGYRSLDGLRAIGMIWIIIYHCFSINVLFSPQGQNYEGRVAVLSELPWYKYWIGNASYQLDMFFSLSGFLIAIILFKDFDKTNTINLKRFFYRRFMRLMPVYLFVIIMTFLVLWFFNDPKRWYLFTNVLYINNFFAYDSNPLPWTWSLAIEEQFYFMFPIFLIIIKNKKFLKWMLGLFILSFIIRYFIVVSNDVLNSSPLYDLLADQKKHYIFLSVLYDNLYTRYGAFICGISAAYLFRYHLDKMKHFLLRTNTGKVLAYTSILIVFYLYLVLNLYKPDILISEFWRDLYLTTNRNIFAIAMTVVMVLLLIEAQSVKYLNKFLKSKIWFPFAQLTYSTYLIHLIVVSAVSYLLSKKFNMVYGSEHYLLLTCLLSIVFSYLLSSVLYYLIEAPFMRWRDAESGQSLRSEIKNKELN